MPRAFVESAITSLAAKHSLQPASTLIGPTTLGISVWLAITTKSTSRQNRKQTPIAENKSKICNYSIVIWFLLTDNLF